MSPPMIKILFGKQRELGVEDNIHFITGIGRTIARDDFCTGVAIK